jgi:hypothetical protein
MYSQKLVKELNPNKFKRTDKKALSFVFKNKKELKEMFKDKFPLSPLDFAVEVPAEKTTYIVNSNNRLALKNAVKRYITLKELQRMGFKN